MDLNSLGAAQLDVLREIANIGAGHAATALSKLTSQRIMVAVPEVTIVPLESIADMLGDPGEVVSAVIVRVQGDVTGRTVQVFPGATASRLTGILLRTKEPAFPEAFGALERSALKEIGNIIVGAYLNALSSFMNMSLSMSVPAFAIDMAGAVVTTSYLNFGSDDDHVLWVNTKLGLDDGADLRAHFMLIPDEPSLHGIFHALHMV
jgi:chemotaxis protein CheC